MHHHELENSVMFWRFNKMNRSTLAVVRIKWHASTTFNTRVLSRVFLKQSIKAVAFSCFKESERQLFLSETLHQTHVAGRITFRRMLYWVCTSLNLDMDLSLKLLHSHSPFPSFLFLFMSTEMPDTDMKTFTFWSFSRNNSRAELCKFL